MALRLSALVAAMVTLAACELDSVAVGGDALPSESGAGDAGPSEPSTDADAMSVDADASSTEGDVAAAAGPITVVMTEAMLTEERLCDLDGDGDFDNAFADLGTPLSTLLVSAMSNAVRRVLEGGTRTVVHFPWVDGLAGPDDTDAVAILFNGDDLDDPSDPSDDFSGSEPFQCRGSCLDECGEPLLFFPSARLEAGELEARDGALALPFGRVDWLKMNGASAMGTVASRGRSAEMDACGYVLISDLGDSHVFDAAEDLSSLELMLVGGAGFGVPAVPGVTPDLDLDGDGLERFLLTEDGYIHRCVDGDGTVIEGRECWRDGRMADGISLNVHVLAVSARFGGRDPGWESRALVDCEEIPERSLWDPS